MDWMAWHIDLWGYKALVDAGAQCTVVPSGQEEAGPIWICGVTGGCQQLSVLEAEMSLTGDKWQKHSVVVGWSLHVSLA